MRTRRWTRWLAGMLVLLGAALVVAAMFAPRFLPPLVTSQLEQQLHAAGFPDARVVVKGISLSRADVALTLDRDGHQNLPDVAAHYTLAGLSQLRVDRLTVRGLTLHLTVDEHGHITIPEQTVTGNDQASNGIPAMPISEIVLENAQVTIGTPYDPLTVIADLSLVQEDAVWKAAGTLELSHPVATFKTDINASLDANGPWQMQANLAQAPVGHDYALIENLHGAVQAEGNKTSVQAARVDLQADSVWLPSGEFSGTNLTLQGDYAVSRPEPLNANVTIQQLFSGHEPSWFAPVAVQGNVSGNPAFTLNFKIGTSGPFNIQAQGQHDVTSGQGRAAVTLKSLVLGHPLSDISPWLAAQVTSLGGTFDGSANVSWDAEGVQGDGGLKIDDASVEYGAVTASGIKGALAFSQLNPVALPQGQTITAEVVNAGVPLTDTGITFSLSPKGILSMTEAHAHWAGGNVLVGPFHLDIAQLSTSTVLTVSGVELARILELAEVEGLAATGTVSGRIPVQLKDNAITIRDGVLEARLPGALRYDPADPPAFLQGDPGSGTDMLMGALTNFHYKALKATLDGTVGGDLSIGLKIEGANPDFYNGYPVALNLNLSGALDTILRQSLETYQIPDTMREQLLNKQMQE